MNEFVNQETWSEKWKKKKKKKMCVNQMKF